MFHQINSISKTTYARSCWTGKSCPVTNPPIPSLILMLSLAGLNNQLLHRGIELDKHLTGAYED